MSTFKIRDLDHKVKAKLMKGLFVFLLKKTLMLNFKIIN